MSEEQQNLDIDQTIAALLNNPTIMDKLVNALGSKLQTQTETNGFCSTAKMGFPQLSEKELIQKAKAMNKGINQEAARAELQRMGVAI